jgi:hypothetical protein
MNGREAGAACSAMQGVVASLIKTAMRCGSCVARRGVVVKPHKVYAALASKSKTRTKNLAGFKTCEVCKGAFL